MARRKQKKLTEFEALVMDAVWALERAAINALKAALETVLDAQ